MNRRQFLLAPAAPLLVTVDVEFKETVIDGWVHRKVVSKTIYNAQLLDPYRQIVRLFTGEIVTAEEAINRGYSIS